MLIDLSIGQPNHGILDVNLLDEVRLGAENVSTYFYYAPKAGDPRLREQLLEITGSGAAGVDQTILTHGVLGGIELAAKWALGSMDRILVAEPGYKEAFAIFRRFQMQPVPLPRSENKIAFDALSAFLKDRHTAMYVVPTLNNPDGWTLDLKDREALAHLCVEARCLVIEDDTYGDLNFDGRRLPSIFELASALSPFHRVLRLSGTAKTIMPGTRIGILEATPAMAEVLLEHKFDFGVSPVLSHIVSLLIGDKARVLANRARLRDNLEARMRLLRSALVESCPQVSWTEPTGGYFIWGTLPHSLDAESLLSIALRHEVSFALGAGFHIDGGRHTLRLSHAYVEEELLATAAVRLGDALREMLQGSFN
jgi:2-aminoadipate transaminase